MFLRFICTWLSPRWTEAVSEMYMIFPSGATTKMNPSRVWKTKEKTQRTRLVPTLIAVHTHRVVCNSIRRARSYIMARIGAARLFYSLVCFVFFAKWDFLKIKISPTSVFPVHTTTARLVIHDLFQVVKNDWGKLFFWGQKRSGKQCVKKWLHFRSWGPFVLFYTAQQVQLIYTISDAQARR